MSALDDVEIASRRAKEEGKICGRHHTIGLPITCRRLTAIFAVGEHDSNTKLTEDVDLDA